MKAEPNELKVPKSKLGEKKSIPASNLRRCALGGNWPLFAILA